MNIKEEANRIIQETKQENRLEKILKAVMENAAHQSTNECRENYLKSVEAHGGDSAEAVQPSITKKYGKTAK